MAIGTFLYPAITDKLGGGGAGAATLAGNNTFTGNNTFNNNITIPATPTNNTDAASKQYVDGIAMPNIAAENTEYKNGRQTFFGKQIYVQYISQQLDLSQTRTITITGATRIINTQLTFSHNQTPTNYAATLPFIVFNSGQTTISQAITTSFTDGTISIIPVGLSGQKYIRGFVFYVK